jgi:putative RecB family exonuclease
VDRSYSVSQIQAYLACPLKYRFQYLDKLPKAFRPAALSFGSSIHAAVEHFHRERMVGRTPEAAEILRIFDADWFAQNTEALLFPPGETKESLAERGKAMLSVYLREAGTSKAVAVEEPFQLDLADPETGEVLDVPLRGIVDLVEEDGTLVDLKTAARAMPQEDIERHLQLSTYALASLLKGGSIPKLRLDVLLKTKQPRLERHPASRSLQDLSWTAQLIKRCVWAIESGHFYPNPSWRCSECEFFGPCQRWRGE